MLKSYDTGCLSFSRPSGFTLFQKSANALFGVICEEITNHDFIADIVCVRIAQIHLRIEGALPDFKRQCTGLGNLLRHSFCFFSQPIHGNDLVDKAELLRLFRGNHPSCEEHFQGSFSTHSANQGYCRRRTEDAKPDAGRPEEGPLFSNSKVACGHELTSGGGGYAMHLSDEGLRHILYFQHEGTARVKHLLVVLESMTYHLRQVVAGRKNLAGAPDNDDLYIVFSLDLIQHAVKLFQHLKRK